MSDFDAYDDNRTQRRLRAESSRQHRLPRRFTEDEDEWADDPEPPRRSSSRSAQPSRNNDDWDDSEDAWRSEVRARRAEERRNSLMSQRLRVARGEEIDDDDDYEDRLPARRYLRREPLYTPSYASTGTGCGASILYLLLGIIAVSVLLLLVGRQMLGSIMPNIPERITTIVATPTTTVFDRGGAIKQIQSLNRLETNSFSIERVIEANVQRGDLLDSILGERLLLIASGNVVAGVDMSKLRESNVNISADGKRITLTLPPSEIFSSSLDNERTHVYDRQTRIFTQIIGGENKDLESQARREAERAILQAACEGGIMQKATDEAQRSLEQFLRLLQFEEVNVISTAGPCLAPSQPSSTITP